MTKVLRYKLRLFLFPIDGSENVYCDNEAVYKKTVKSGSVLRKKNHSVAYNQCC